MKSFETAGKQRNKPMNTYPTLEINLKKTQTFDLEILNKTFQIKSFLTPSAWNVLGKFLSF